MKGRFEWWENFLQCLKQALCLRGRQLAGFLSNIFYQDPGTGNLRAKVGYLKMIPNIPEAKGILKGFVQFERELIAQLGIPALEWESDWLGRWAWAKDIDFDPGSLALENGQEVTQLELARHQLQRFLDFHSIQISELSWGFAQDLRPLHSLEELHTPRDFASLHHAQGRKILTAPYVDYGTLGTPAEMEIGKAFMLADYRPNPDQANTVIQSDGVSVSDRAMPNWFGVLLPSPLTTQRRK